MTISLHVRVMPVIALFLAFSTNAAAQQFSGMAGDPGVDGQPGDSSQASWSALAGQKGTDGGDGETLVFYSADPHVEVMVTGGAGGTGGKGGDAGLHIVPITYGNMVGRAGDGGKGGIGGNASVTLTGFGSVGAAIGGAGGNGGQCGHNYNLPANC
ncbi:MAG: hypothetical protein ACI9S9_003697, partial [Planctomycetota bacterium]